MRSTKQGETVKAHRELGKQQEAAKRLDERAERLVNQKIATSFQEGVDIAVARQQHLRKVSRRLTKHEKARDEATGKAYYFRPEDELKGEEYLLFLKNRDVRILNEARKRLKERKFSSRGEYLEALEQEIHDIKYFSVILVSAPHLGHKVSADFPGHPTPLMYTTSIIDRYERTDTFPADRSPEIVSLHNPSVFSDEFVHQFTKEIQEKQPRVVCVSNTSEGHFFAIQIARIVRQHSPNTLIILGGSHEDGTNPEAYLQSKIQKKYDLSQADHEKVRRQMTLEKESERSFFDVVVAGDGQYALVELLKIVGNSHSDDRNQIIREVLGSKELFRSLEGSGNVFAVNPDSQTVETMRLSGTPLDWNALPLMFRGRLTSENRFGFPLYEVENGTGFIYSFSIGGINNRRFVEELDQQGVFVSYIDRTKIQTSDTSHEGNGVIRASFSYWNTVEQMDAYNKKIGQALQNVYDEEVRGFENSIDVVGMGKKSRDVLKTLGVVYEAVKSPVRRIAIAASVILVLVYGHRLMEPYMYGNITVDPSFIKYSQASFERHQRSWEQVKLKMDEDGIGSIPWTILDRAYVERYYAQKYSFLMKISDGEYVTRELRDSLESYSYYSYSDEERKQIIRSAQESRNPYLKELAKSIAKPGDLTPEDIIWLQEDTKYV